MKKDTEFTAGTGDIMPSSRRETEEDMLEQFCILANKRMEITVPDICRRMDLTRREVNFYLKQMVLHGYILPPKEKENIILTEFGRITGEEFRYRHEIFTQFLQFVGVQSDRAEEDACRIEHVVSEETVQQICNFVDYGDTFERILKYSDLRTRYNPGTYTFIMGIYYMEKTCPRRLAVEFQQFSENILLHVEKKYSYFELIRTKDKGDGWIWYKDPEQGWMRAEQKEGNPWIPSGVFEFSTRRQDPVTEGNVLIAFTREGERPLEWNCRELDVHIWKVGV